ncbi:MAG: hypothetical protein JKY11_02240 [Alphaproteobacteria bacterium]|nr:hypothetical protein [Alphaproteobacteria bacterium]
MNVSELFKRLAKLPSVLKAAFDDDHKEGVLSLPPVRILVDANMGRRDVEDIDSFFGGECTLDMIGRVYDTNASDPRVYSFACERGYDLIFTHDAKIMFDDDLCTVVNRSFLNGDEKKVPVVAFTTEVSFQDVLGDFGDQILDLGRNKTMAVLDTRDVPDHRNITGTRDPEITKYVPYIKRYRDKAGKNAPSVVEGDESPETPAKGKWLREYIKKQAEQKKFDL